MAQKIVFGGIAASGIVGVLFAMGVVSKLLGISQGDIAINAAIFFGIIFATLEKKLKL